MKRSVDLQLALTHQFKDPEWIGKFLLGGLVAMVPILNFALVGYEVRVIQRVREQNDQTLPKWDDLGTYFQEGLMLGLARIIYVFPILFIMFAGLGLYAVMLVLGLSLADASRQDTAVFTVLSVVSVLLWVVTLGFVMVYGWVISLFMPAMLAHFTQQRTFGACFQFKAIFDLVRRNSNNYLLVYFTGVAANMVITFLFLFINFIPCLNYILILVIGLPAVLWALTSQSHAIGQLLAADSGSG